MSKIEKIRAEIGRQMKFYDEKEMTAWVDSEQGDEDALWYQGHRKMCAKLLTFLDTLEEEPEVDLEKETKSWILNECGPSDFSPFADHWCADDIMATARHFYELGKQAMKQQMLKDAVEGKVYFQMGDIKRVKSDDFENPDIHLGDKVKLIIVKED